MWIESSLCGLKAAVATAAVAIVEMKSIAGIGERCVIPWSLSV